MAQAMEAVGTDGKAIVEYLQSPEARFDVMKTREAYFDPKNHQLMQEIYAITALPADQVKNEWDIFTVSGPIPGPDQPLETLTQNAVGGTCTFAD